METRLAPDPPSATDEKKRKDKTFVIEVDRQDRPARVWVQDLAGGAPRPVSAATPFAAGFDWAPDGNTIAYAASLTGALSTRTELACRTPRTRGRSRTRSGR